ncbi:hypothetical protein ACP4OV_021077 [Aristida adscensionis]
MATMRKVSVPAVLLLLAVLAFVFVVHGLYGLIELFGSPELSPEATLLIFALCFLVLAAAAAAGNHRRLLRASGGGIDFAGGQGLPTTAAVGGEPQLIAGDEEELARRADLQTQDYPGSGANSRHDPHPH